MRFHGATRVALVTALVGGGVAALPPAVAHGAVGTVTATLEKTTNTGKGSSWSHPSPDPSGITYNSVTGKLIISDGEVEETNLSYHVYKGTNLYVASLGGQLLETGANTMTSRSGSYSTEPTGVGFRPTLSSSFPERLFVSDDDKARIFEVAKGSDGRYGTSDDSQTSSDVRFLDLGARNDAEDVAVDLEQTSDGRLLLVDGKGKRVFLYNPGSDNVFNGSGDFVERVINVGNMGAGDPEGIAYNKFRKTMLVLDDPSNTIYEVALDGTLLNRARLPFTMKSGAGITLAPPSDGSGPWNAYIVDRGVDNDTSAENFNDGRIYEVAIPELTGDGGTPPADTTAPDTTITSAPSGTVSETSASISFTSSEAGSTFECRLDGSSFAACSSPKTYSGLADGSHTFAVRATDASGNTDGSPATTSWTVQAGGSEPPPAGSGVLDIPVRASSVSGTSDDAEERTRSGSVALGSGDLNLAQEDSYPTAVGMRFTGVTVPAGATITRAYVTFTADETKSAGSNLTFAAEVGDAPATFTTASQNITKRPATTAKVAWAPSAWSTVGAKHQSPELKTVLQELVGNSANWDSGDPVVLLVTGSGERTAESYEGGAAKAPVLHIEYTTP